jgi:predicted dehydrogenase
MSVQRRMFLGQALTAASSMRVSGANDRVVLGLIGCGGRGVYVGGFMRQAAETVFGAVCDVYLPNARKAKDSIAPGAEVYQDFRRVLERKDIDAVLVATPDHWHAIPTVLACQAGKHVYVEKPLAHNIREGRAMVDAARRYRRIVQPGTQHRSAPHFAEVARIVQSGALGEVHFVRVWNYANLTPDGIGRVPDEPVPEGLDWEMYLGPAPSVPFNRKRFLASYRFFRDYSGGHITDFGTHRFDTVHQVMGVDAPHTISAAGGRFVLRGAGDVPDLIQVTYEYPGFVMSYEASLLNGHGVGGRTAGMQYYRSTGPDDRPNGMAFYGTAGALFADRIGYEIYPEPARRGSERPLERKYVKAADATAQHAAAFIGAIRGAGQPAADVLTGHRATAVAHLGNIALAAGRKLKWNAETETFDADADAAQWLGRKPRRPWDLI